MRAHLTGTVAALLVPVDPAGLRLVHAPLELDAPGRDRTAVAPYIQVAARGDGRGVIECLAAIDIDAHGPLRRNARRRGRADQAVDRGALAELAPHLVVVAPVAHARPIAQDAHALVRRAREVAAGLVDHARAQVRPGIEIRIELDDVVALAVVRQSLEMLNRVVRNGALLEFRCAGGSQVSAGLIHLFDRMREAEGLAVGVERAHARLRDHHPHRGGDCLQLLLGQRRLGLVPGPLGE
ncbi:hypothetical protein PTE30175_04706 [Pandoraea terrae]|uniref:Uncharacterized protein n=1 Tax=Pandoraea terrae TaxID=1537710 RepID=A0A5E4YXY3_9BURK|nr:hypothetical protein PTE30175_04706 [Pandoraea terrae]